MHHIEFELLDSEVASGVDRLDMFMVVLKLA